MFLYSLRLTRKTKKLSFIILAKYFKQRLLFAQLREFKTDNPLGVTVYNELYYISHLNDFLNI
jgi:hypothetical protein